MRSCVAGTDDLQRLVDAVEPVAGERLQVPGPVARRAWSVVASYARDEEDCLLLLQVLGLTQEGESMWGRSRGSRAGPTARGGRCLRLRARTAMRVRAGGGVFGRDRRRHGRARAARHRRPGTRATGRASTAQERPVLPDQGVGACHGWERWCRGLRRR
ncbi:hypothetical protein GCM10010495_77140 [Kitasatospora herbaricolor]|nr:hypothetical protein GCM10010495_77140 [Kitasatospora herbaricolor]